MDRLKAMPTWAKWALGIFALLLIIGALGGGDDEDEGQPASNTTSLPAAVPPAVSTTDTTTAATQTTTTTTPGQTIQDAQTAIDDDDYPAALAIAALLTAAEANKVRRRISNRIARRVRFALSTGDRSRAQRLLRQADSYPTTAALRRARADYRTARERASARARQERLAAEQRRAAKRAAEEAAREREAAPPPPPASEPSVPSGGTCADTPMTNFPVPPGDPRDRDGDGIACES